MQSVEREENAVLSGECSVKWGLWSVECKVRSAKCTV